MQVTYNFLFIDLANSYFNNNYNTGNFLVVQWLGHGAFTDEGLVRALVRELRSHKPPAIAK